MSNRCKLRDINAEQLGLHPQSLKIKILDHLTPKMQNVFLDAKKFKEDHHYTYCWTKNDQVCLRRDSEAPATKIKNSVDLLSLVNRE